MAVLGRILQIVGWVWVAVGFFGPMLDLPGGLNFFPGFILVFVSRIFRTQAARNASHDDESEPLAEEPQQRAFNTDRGRTTPAPEPRPTGVEPSKTKPVPTDSIFKLTPPEPKESKDHLLEQILLAGKEVADQPAGPPDDITPADVADPEGPISSAEMIARAKRRWDKR